MENKIIHFDSPGIFFENNEAQPFIKICNNSNGNILIFPTPMAALQDFVKKHYCGEFIASEMLKKPAKNYIVAWSQLPKVWKRGSGYYVSAMIFVKPND